MTIMEAVIGQLVADAGVGALVADRIYPGAAPQGATSPLIVVNTVSIVPGYADDGETGLDQTRIQIDCYASTYTASHTVSTAVRAALSAAFTPEMLYPELDVVRDLRDTGTNETAYQFRRSMDFNILATP